ncbi:MAG: NAD(P)-dependent glycerol-3-phosphate dehydrogenase [Geminicoccaceae bacterium]|nr:NAD(P)-dependent glycerol-3-phosphate dehydrogenase [Geminicoccaceae bacterium]
MEQEYKATTVGIVGAGSWGTALAVALARPSRPVRLWGRDGAAAARMRATRQNERHLPGVVLPASVEVVESFEAAAAPVLLLAVPAQAVAGLVAPLRGRTEPLLLCAKGIDRASGRLLGEIVEAALPGARVGALSGPSFAREVAVGLPTALTLAMPDQGEAAGLAARLGGGTLRLYPSDDRTGVETGGALKNVIAIAAGIVMGQGLGENARAALVTRGLAEIVRLGIRLGARPETLMGLSGLGDLMLTATSTTSRNTRLGLALGRGQPPPQDLSEGAFTAEAALRLARTHGVDLPITGAVARILKGDLAVEDATALLLARPPPAAEL